MSVASSDDDSSAFDTGDPGFRNALILQVPHEQANEAVLYEIRNDTNLLQLIV